MSRNRRRTFLLCTLLVLGAFCLFALKDHISLYLSNVDQQYLWRLQGPLKNDDPHVVSHLRQKYLIPPSTLSYNFSGKTIENSFHFRVLESHFYTSFIRKTFNNTQPGFFVEAGALDGELGSNSLWLEKSRNWTGLLIEASPRSCEALKKKHRKAWVSCSCITPKEYPETIVLEMASGKVWDVWLYRATSRGVESKFHSWPTVVSKSSTFTYTNVQCFPLYSYLKALNVSTVDLLSLDIQGGEKSILLTFPFDKIRIKHILVEHYDFKQDPVLLDKDFVNEMKKRSYELVLPFRNTGEYIFSLKE